MARRGGMTSMASVAAGQAERAAPRPHRRPGPQQRKPRAVRAVPASEALDTRGGHQGPERRRPRGRGHVGRAKVGVIRNGRRVLPARIGPPVPVRGGVGDSAPCPPLAAPAGAAPDGLGRAGAGTGVGEVGETLGGGWGAAEPGGMPAICEHVRSEGHRLLQGRLRGKRVQGGGEWVGLGCDRPDSSMPREPELGARARTRSELGEEKRSWPSKAVLNRATPVSPWLPAHAPPRAPARRNQSQQRPNQTIKLPAASRILRRPSR
eukprot:scaffold7837_cov89-Isochrysis_galbana.AAC.1